MNVQVLILLLWLGVANGLVYHSRTIPHHHSVIMGHSKENEKHGFTPAPTHGTTKTADAGCTGDNCVLPVQCPAHVTKIPLTNCTISGGKRGVCCTTGQNHTAFNNPSFHRHHHLVKVDKTMLKLVTRRSREQLEELRDREAEILTSDQPVIVPIGSASYGHFKNSRLFNKGDLMEVMGVANRALEIALATRAFKDRQGLTNEDLEYGLIQEDLRFTPLGTACSSMPSCASVTANYRRIDGACNNFYNPMWGMARTPYSRLLPPSYQDGIFSPRVSETDGKPLSSPRLISTTIFGDVDKVNEDYTLMLMQFGQFLSHDITQSIDTSFGNGSAISCCTEDGANEIPREFRHFACMPITIPANDPFYSHFKQGCMNFVRSMLAPRADCTMGYAQQMNKVSHHLDGSVIYGSTPEQTRDVRAFTAGRLAVFQDFNRDLLPLSKDPEACLTMEQGSACFTSGDTRTNQMISLVVVHLIFVREHNRIAGELSQMNPHWDDEKIFLETKRIVTAILQVIIYKEYLPALLGEVAMEEFGLNLATGMSYSYSYDQRVEPSVINEFASAAFRFGHSTVSGLLNIYGLSRMEEAIDIPEVMFFPSRMRRKKFYDQVLSYLTTEPIQEVDDSMAEALTNYLFRGGNPFGVDLAAINIQRGRDHGLRPYNDYRELVGQPRIKDFNDFGPELGNKLRQVYNSVEDIDVWVGGLLEPKYAGSILGNTFRDIIAEQFSRLKRGDKYFFENDPTINPGFFAKEQLVELRRASLSRLICDNSDQFLLARQARNAFRRPGSPGNEFLNCAGPDIPRINLGVWKE